MKTIYTFAVLLLVNISLFSQPILNASNTNPSIGETFQMNYSNPTLGTSPGPSGANVTFDLSSLANSQSINVNVSNPGSTFSGANILVDWAGGSQSFYNMNATKQEIVGIAASTIQMPYSNPETQMVYPCQLGTTNTDTWKTSFTSGLPFVRTGTTTITGDAWGKLILPNGTYNNVLRVKMVQDYTDSTSSIGLYTTYNTVTYFYYLPGNHQPIAAVNVLTAVNFAGTTTVFNADYYLNSIVTSVKDINNLDLATVDIFPNPTSKSFSIFFKEARNNLDFKIYDLNGKPISIDVKQNTNQKFDIELSQAVSAGMYSIMIFEEGRLLGTSKINFYNN